MRTLNYLDEYKKPAREKQRIDTHAEAVSTPTEQDKTKIVGTRTAREMTKATRIAAISWAAQRQGTTYGRLVGTLGPAEKEQIYAEYEEYQAARERETDARIEATREVVKRLNRTHSVVPPGSRFDPRLTNSVVNTEAEDVPGDAPITKGIV